MENPPTDSLAEGKVLVRRLLEMQGSERHADIHTQVAGRLMNFIRDDLRYSKFPKLIIGNGNNKLYLKFDRLASFLVEI